MELFELLRKLLILRIPPAQPAGSPLVVRRTRSVEQRAGQLDGTPRFFVRFPDRSIDSALSYFRKASLLSISSIFLADHASFPPDTACA